jgi:uncharacterized repeat protein (TIGR01451 family)
MRYKGSSWSAPLRGRFLLASLALVTTAAAGVLAATAVPALANNGSGHGNGNSHAVGHGGNAGAVQGKSGSGGGGHNNGGGNAGGNGHGATHVTICHATPPDTAANGYVVISPSASGVYHGHLRQHDADIIPPFVYNGVTYSLNWDATGQAIWNNGCHVPASSSGTTTTTTPTTTTTSAPAPPVHLGLWVKKLERVGATGSFVRGPLTAKVGDTVFYEIVVGNTSTVPLSITLSDSHCDAGTLLPAGTVTVASGAETIFTCSHVLTSADGSTYWNVATASGYSSATASTVTAASRVRANVSASGVAGAQKTVKKVTHRARPARAVVRGASYTG